MKQRRRRHITMLPQSHDREDRKPVALMPAGRVLAPLRACAGCGRGTRSPSGLCRLPACQAVRA